MKNSILLYGKGNRPTPKSLAILFLMWSVFVNISIANAQEVAQRQFEIDAGGSFFLYDTDPGWGVGGNIRLLLPVYRNNNYITVGIAFDRLTQQVYREKDNYSFINATASYRKMINKFFLGPQLGGGLYAEDDFNYIEFNTFLGFEAGLIRNNLSFQVDYRFHAADGFVLGEQFHVFAVKIGVLLGAKRSW